MTRDEKRIVNKAAASMDEDGAKDGTRVGGAPRIAFPRFVNLKR